MWLAGSRSLRYGTPCTAVSDRRLNRVTRLVEINLDGTGAMHYGVCNQFADHQRGVADDLRVAVHQLGPNEAPGDGGRIGGCRKTSQMLPFL